MTNFKTLPPDRNWRTWYNLEVWLRRRALQLSHDPLCAICLQHGVVTPATIADHVDPHKGNWNKFRLGKLQSLCKACHDSRKRLFDLHGYSHDIGNDGWPIDPRHPANKQRHGTH